MDDHINECLGNTNSFDEEFLRDILQQPEETTSASVAASLLTPIATAAAAAGSSIIFGQSLMIKNNSSIISQHVAQYPTSSQTTYILSFDKATTLLPNGHDPCSAWKEVSQSQLGNHATESLPLFSSKTSQVTKKTRNASETLDHIMSERNRRQELTKKFIALSATIPGLKKMEKAYVLGEAINYVKQLQERVKELEEDVQKNGTADQSVITITRSHLCIDDGTAAFCETNTNEYCYVDNESLPDVEARVLGKDVLIKIHCEKQKGILVKILSQLERLHLSISSSNVLPFGNTLDITIIAQMDDKYKLIVKDLVKSLGLAAMLKSCDVQQ